MKYMKTLIILCLLFGWQASPARAAGDVPGSSLPNSAMLGNDVSWPQCGTELPRPAEFAVFGVNAGRPDTTNPCLAAQLAWAAGTATAADGSPVPVYVNTANPGPNGSWWWPASNAYDGNALTNPYGVCDGTSSPACAYVYGYAMAFEDANLRGVPDPAHRVWWLDAETGNSWSADPTANKADMEGMTAYLASIGAAVGIYSTAQQFDEIAAVIDPGSNLNELKNWIPGADSTVSAQENCSGNPLTPGGIVTLAQFTVDSLDYDVACPVAPPPAATTSHSPPSRTQVPFLI